MVRDIRRFGRHQETNFGRNCLAFVNFRMNSEHFAPAVNRQPGFRGRDSKSLVTPDENQVMVNHHQVMVNHSIYLGVNKYIIKPLV